MYAASPARCSTLPYHRCGKSGLMLPAVSLGLWHNFGDTANFESMRLLCRAAFGSGKMLMNLNDMQDGMVNLARKRQMKA